MKRSLAILAATLAVTGSIHAQDPFTLEANGFLFSRGDFNNDSRSDLVLVDQSTGTIRLATQLGTGSFTWGDVQPSGIETPEALAVGKFYTTTHDAIAVGSPLANRIHLFGITNPAELFTPKAIYPSAPGPSSLAAFNIDATGTAELLAIGEGLAPLVNKGPGKVYEALSALNGTPTTTWSASFPNRTLRINPVRPKLGVAPRVLEIYGPPGGATSSLFLEIVGPTGLSTPISGGSIASDSRHSTGPLDATGLSHILSWVPGQATLRTQRVNETTPGVFSFAPAVTHTLAAGIQLAVPVQTGAAARIAVLFTNGTVTIFDFDGSAAPLVRTTITDFPADLILPLESGNFLVAAGLRGTAPQWRRYAPNAATYQIVQSGTAPAATPARQLSNILFLSGEPFVTPDVTPRAFQNFREWTTTATPASGIAWNIQSLSFDNPSSGLGGSQSVTLSGTTGTDFPLLNQYSNALSIFSLEAKTGTNLADIVFDPPPGTYAPPPTAPIVPGAPAAAPFPVVQVRLATTEPGFTLRYRTSPTADYTNVPADGLLDLYATTTLHVFGQKSGQRTPVRSATYTIAPANPLNLPPTADLDADGLPDDWEAAFNLGNPAGDEDLDGYTNLEEALHGGDPALVAPIPSIPPRLRGRVTLGAGGDRIFRLEWPAGDTLSTLQSSTQLGGWTDHPGGPVVVEGFHRVDILLSPLVPNGFFRLRR